jgi:hypothetical protein
MKGIKKKDFKKARKGRRGRMKIILPPTEFVKEMREKF